MSSKQGSKNSYKRLLKVVPVCAAVVATVPLTAFASATLDVFFDSNTVSLGGDKTLPAYVSCQSDSSSVCRGTVKATAKVKGRTQTIATGNLETTSGNAGQVDLKFSSKAVKELKKKNSLTVTVKAKVGSDTDSGKVKVTK